MVHRIDGPRTEHRLHSVAVCGIELVKCTAQNAFVFWHADVCNDDLIDSFSLLERKYQFYSELSGCSDDEVSSHGTQS